MDSKPHVDVLHTDEDTITIPGSDIITLSYNDNTGENRFGSVSLEVPAGQDIEAATLKLTEALRVIRS